MDTDLTDGAFRGSSTLLVSHAPSDIAATNQLLKEKPKITKPQMSSALLRARMFLPQLQQENVKLSKKIEAEGTKSVSIEEVDDSKGNYVEMNLALGVLKEKKGEASELPQLQLPGKQGMNKCIKEVEPESTKFNNLTSLNKRKYLRAKRQASSAKSNGKHQQAASTVKQHTRPFEEQHIKVKTDEEALKELANVLYGDVDALLSKSALTGDQEKLRALQSKLEQRNGGMAVDNDGSSGDESGGAGGNSSIEADDSANSDAEDLEL